MLESRGETKTAAEMREMVKELDSVRALSHFVTNPPSRNIPQIRGLKYFQTRISFAAQTHDQIPRSEL